MFYESFSSLKKQKLGSVFFNICDKHLPIKLKQKNVKYRKVLVKMADWTIISYGKENLTWNEFVDYFWSQPVFGQVLIVIGVATLLTLIGIGLYYLIKGIAYGLYYLFKGIAYLLYYIFLGIGYIFYGVGLGLVKLVQWIYYGITGKPRPVKQKKEIEAPKTEAIPNNGQQVQPEPVQKFPSEIIAQFKKVCPGCGVEFSENIVNALKSQGIAYCEHCGKGFKAEIVEIESQA